MATTAASLPERLRDAALRCCEDGGIEESEASAREFLDLLERPLYDLELRKSSAGKWLAQCERVLQEAVELLDPSSSSGLDLLEKVGLELPKVAVKFVSLSQACQDHCLSIIEDLAENCSPREMFAAFMEALNIYSASETLIYCIPLVQGLSLVFSRLQRRQHQFFQEASSGLLALVRLAAQDDDDEDEEEEEESVQAMDGQNKVPLKQVRAAIVDDIVQVALTVRETCDTVDVDEHREDFQQRLGMFALQILGIAGEKIAHPGREVPLAVIELVELLPYCGVSVFLLLTGDQIQALIETTADEVAGSSDQVAQANQKKSEATKGAALAVYWALSNIQVAEGAGITLDSLKEGLRFTGRKGVIAALSVATSLLAGRSLRPLSPVPATGLALVSTILDLASSLEFSIDDEEEDGGVALTLHILPALQRLENVVVYAPSIEMRRQGYGFIKKIIQDVLPENSRLQSLQMLISNCIYPSLVSLHLICIKDEVAKAWPPSPQQKGLPSGDVHSVGESHRLKHFSSPFVSEDVLEVIGNVLKPDGGAPELPPQIDSVQSALNLYRFILIRESSGKTNYTGILSKETLKKARTECLLPLREAVGQMSLALLEDDDEVSADMRLAIDSLQSVVYRCLELNEEALAQL
ncbi:hypothetical protein M758_3G176700 [Ceratodon purpureus]|nr:hypothetical protein M758_3G176700 [Ceratodon purpureus]